MILVISKQREPNSREISGVRLFLWSVYQLFLYLWLKINYVNPLLYTVSVSGAASPGYGVLCIFIGDLTIKNALLLFSIIGARKPYLEKRPVIGNHNKCL